MAVKVSVTANNNEVNRAANRSEILGRATVGPAMDAVIASRIDEPQRELAARRDVAAAVHPE